MVLADLDSKSMYCNWMLEHPFLTYGKTEISFLHKRPLPLRWTATLRLTHRTLREWGVVFSLSCTDVDEEYQDVSVVARKAVLLLLLEGEVAHRHCERGHVFSEDNDHTISFPEIRIRARPEDLGCAVLVEFQEREAVKMNLEQLSWDLEKLYRWDRYSDFSLGTEDSETVYPVHECMLRARLPSLARNVPERVTREHGTAKLKYPTDALRYVLHYAYTGKGESAREEHRTPNFQQKMRALVNEYRLRRIARVFFEDAWAIQDYETQCHVIEEGISFRLAYVSDGIQRESTLAGATGLEMHAGITFSLWQRENPSFAYEMTFACEVPVVIRMIGKYCEEGVERALLFEHIHRTNSITGEYVFEEVSPEMGVFLSRCRNGEDLQDIERWLSVEFCLSNGSSTVRLRNQTKKKQREYKYDLNLLSNDMLLLLNSQAPSDLTVHCGDIKIPVDRAVLAARIPNWRAWLEPFEGDRVLEEDHIPGKLRSHLRFDAVKHIIDFIYSGKVFPCSQNYFDEVYNAAYASGMYYLAAIWLIWKRDDDGSSEGVVE